MSTILSQRLKMLKDEKHLSQRDMAKIAQTSETNVSRYINYEREPCLSILANLARGLNVTTDFLLGLSDVENPKPELNGEQRVLLAALSRVSDRDAKLIWSILESYITPTEQSFLDSIGSSRNNIA